MFRSGNPALIATWLILALSTANLGYGDQLALPAALSDRDNLLSSNITLKYKRHQPLPAKPSAETQNVILSGNLIGWKSGWGNLLEGTMDSPLPDFPGDIDDVPYAKFDELGRMLLSRPALMATIREGEVSATLREYWRFRIGKSDMQADAPTTRDELLRTTLHIRRPRSEFQDEDIFMPLLGAGFGYSKLIKEIISIETDASGKIYCKALGVWPGADLPEAFRYELQIEPATDLVTMATLRPLSGDEVLCKFVTVGHKLTSHGAIPATTIVTFQPSLLHIHKLEFVFEYTDLTLEIDADLLNNLRAKFSGTYPDGTSVIDETQGSRPYLINTDVSND